MAAVPTLIALESPAIDQPMPRAMAAGTAEPIGPARLLQSCHCYAEPKGYALFLDALEPLELRQ
jgi:hypothetical protein